MTLANSKDEHGVPAAIPGEWHTYRNRRMEV